MTKNTASAYFAAPFLMKKKVVGNLHQEVSLQASDLATKTISGVDTIKIFVLVKVA